MKESWTSGLEPDMEKEVRGDFLSSRVTRHRLAQLIDKKIESNHSVTLAKAGYDSPNWAYKQADAIGFERALKEVLSLIQD